MSLTAPVALIIYRRPRSTARVMEALRRARPDRLFMIADGPRADRPDDAERCAAARGVAEQVDWPCEVTRIYAVEHMGLRSRVESGLNTVFAAVERAIILEDDCVPEPSFFAYCDELLARYADDARVMAVAGSNFQAGRRRGQTSYYFSRYPHCWGWAGWRRAWRHYDGPMADWPRLRASGWLEQLLGDRRAARYWRARFDEVYAGQLDSWAYRWTYSCWRKGGLTALPQVNLVANIGFDAEATHTQIAPGPLATWPTRPLDFPLRHPSHVAANGHADEFTQRNLYNPGLCIRILQRLKRGFSSLKIL